MQATASIKVRAVEVHCAAVGQMEGLHSHHRRPHTFRLETQTSVLTCQLNVRQGRLACAGELCSRRGLIVQHLRDVHSASNLKLADSCSLCSRCNDRKNSA